VLGYDYVAGLMRLAQQLIRQLPNQDTRAAPGAGPGWRSCLPGNNRSRGTSVSETDCTKGQCLLAADFTLAASSA
jgi:hypothetical protein